MKPDEYFIPYAKAAYEAWLADVAYLKNQYKAAPGAKWEHLGTELQGRWINATKAVFKLLDVVDADTGEAFVS